MIDTLLNDNEFNLTTIKGEYALRVAIILAAKEAKAFSGCVGAFVRENRQEGRDKGRGGGCRARRETHAA